MNSRERVLALFEGRELDRIPCFSGMGNVTTAGLELCGYNFSEVHDDARKMAATAATSYRLYGLECAVVPYDLCVEAEALGCVMNPYEGVDQLLFPTIKEKIVAGEEDMATFPIPEDFLGRGRIETVCEAIGLLRKEIGEQVVIGSYILGPFTLAGQVMDLNTLFKLSFKKQDKVNAMLERLTGVLIAVARKFREAGADYITVREMGATTDVLSPRVFKAVIFSHLKRIFDALDFPAVLHICGSTNLIMKELKETGAKVISVEQKNDLKQSREDIGWETLLLGNVDAYNVLAKGTPEEVEEAVKRSIEGGVDAVWPSCDIWPTAPLANLRAFTKATQIYGGSK